MLKKKLSYLKLTTFAMLLITSLIANAVELGSTTVFSFSSQPLSVDVYLVSLAPDDITLLTVLPATADVYKQAGISMTPALSSLQAAITHLHDRPRVHLTSSQPVEGAYLNVFLELIIGDVRVVRPVTIWLGPAPLVDPASPAKIIAVNDSSLSAPIIATTSIFRSVQPTTTPSVTQYKMLSPSPRVEQLRTVIKVPANNRHHSDIAFKSIPDAISGKPVEPRPITAQLLPSKEDIAQHEHIVASNALGSASVEQEDKSVVLSALTLEMAAINKDIEGVIAAVIAPTVSLESTSVISVLAPAIPAESTVDIDMSLQNPTLLTAGSICLGASLSLLFIFLVWRRMTQRKPQLLSLAEQIVQLQKLFI
jgi:hypothetical protein